MQNGVLCTNKILDWICIFIISIVFVLFSDLPWYWNFERLWNCISDPIFCSHKLHSFIPNHDSKHVILSEWLPSIQFSSKYLHATFRVSIYDHTTSRKFSAGAWSWVRAILGGSKSAQNHGILVPQIVCGKSFIMRTTGTSKWVEMLWNQGLWLQTTIVTR